MILKPPKGIILNRNHLFAHGLVGCWLMNEGGGGKIFDLSGNGKTGTFVGDTHFVPGKFGYCLYFDGTGDYVLTTANLYSMLGTNASKLSVNLWFRCSVSPYDRLICCRSAAGNNNGFEIYLHDDSSYILAAIDTTTGYHSGYVTVKALDDTWRMLTLTWDGTDAYIYMNGIYNTTFASGGTISEDATLLFGVDYSLNPARYYTGKLDNIMIFNRALSASEIALLNREPFCMFEDLI